MSHLRTTSESKRHVAFSNIMLELYRSLNVHSGIRSFRSFKVCARCRTYLMIVFSCTAPFSKRQQNTGSDENNIERMTPLYFQSLFSGCRKVKRGMCFYLQMVKESASVSGHTLVCLSATYDIQTLMGDTFNLTISLAQRPEWQQPMIRRAFEILKLEPKP
jgi:hypothetical protein